MDEVLVAERLVAERLVAERLVAELPGAILNKYGNYLKTRLKITIYIKICIVPCQQNNS